MIQRRSSQSPRPANTDPRGSQTKPPGMVDFFVYGYDEDIGWIYHTNRSQLEVGVSNPVTTFSILLGDLSGDAAVDYDDLFLLTQNWLSSELSADIDTSGTVDMKDFSMLAGNWAKQYEE